MVPVHTRKVPPHLGAFIRDARDRQGLTARELGRRAGVAHTQVNRLENGEVTKPSRKNLIALSRALGRNPLPLLIVGGFMSVPEAQAALRPMFRSGAELPEEWGDWTVHDLEAVRRIIRDEAASERDIRLIAADVFRVEETDETLWDDSYVLAASRGVDAEQLREVMAIWRNVDRDLRERWLEYGRRLRDIADMEWEAEREPS